MDGTKAWMEQDWWGSELKLPKVKFEVKEVEAEAAMVVKDS